MLKKINTRAIRASVALLATAALITVIIFSYERQREANYQMTLKVSSMFWKLSELFYESHSTIRILKDFNAGLVPISDVQTRVDITWSRLITFERTHIALSDELENQLTQVYAWLERCETVFFTHTTPSAAMVDELSNSLQQIIGQIRTAWINSYLNDRRGIVKEALIAVQGKSKRLDIAMIACLATLIIYLAAELYFSNRSSAAERRLKEAALEGSRAKSAFLSNISHEMRTPLNGILGMAQDLKETDLKYDQRISLDVIHDSAGTLLETINNVIEIAAIGADSAPLNKVPLDIRLALKKVADAYAKQASDKNIDLVLNCHDSVPEQIFGDPAKIMSMVGHLVSNAVKYTDKGTVSIKAHAKKSEETGDIQLALSVTDTGIGMSEDILATIFEPFRRADETRCSANAGVGLGLALANEICRNMNGILSADSKTGQGSTFTCLIPIHAVPMAELRTNLSYNFTPTDQFTTPVSAKPNAVHKEAITEGQLRILVVDDSATNRLVVKKLLKDTKVELAEAENGEVAVIELTKNEYDVILMDIQMPVLDGVEATRRIRKIETANGRQRSKIFALTANVLPQQVDEYFQVGMDDVLAKPINKQALIVRLRSMLNSRESVEVSHSPTFGQVSG